MGGSDFYQVLGLSKECTEAELKTAYKKLALKWHPDRCSDSKYVEEAKMKFQAIQEAYSGVYDSDDDQDGMADFMGEMAVLMSQNKPNADGRYEVRNNNNKNNRRKGRHA
ncbi:chaperone protein DnaJ-like isoform X8 [Helianthus annuus]|uniref:chaperone protein DnaJ-like isoform X8 n=1 Tax=Helianthus annuus TaxID=4232 RepID=UPI001652D931|nr:chaperone protein DnaJ-like isoform X8 [Helianthus annuus]